MKNSLYGLVLDPDPDLGPVQDPERVTPQKDRKPTAGTNKEAAMCTACKDTLKAATAAAARVEPEAVADMSTATTRGATMGVAMADSREMITTIHTAANSEETGSRGADRTAADAAATSGTRMSPQESIRIQLLF